MADMPVLHGISYGEHQLELAAARGEQITAWRDKRRVELESGDDMAALLRTLQMTPRNNMPCEELETILLSILQPSDEARLEAWHQMQRAIDRTLAYEVLRGDWK